MAEIELPKAEEIEEAKQSRFTRNVALTVAAYAVALAIVSLGGNNAAKEMMLAQQQASNKWAHYQAKASREHQYRLERLRWEIEIEQRETSLSAAAREKTAKHLAKIAEEEARYEKEKKEIEAEARDLEKVRDLNMRRDPYFDYAEVLLQIAIVIASIAMLSSSRPIFAFSLVLALVGAFLGVNGFGLFFNIPLLGAD